MVPVKFVVPAIALIAAALQSQQPAQTAAAEPTIAGTVKDAGGLPVADVEVGVVHGERLQQFVTTAADGKFLITGVPRGVVPLRIRRLGYTMRYLEVDTRLPAAAAMDIVLKTAPSELEEVVIAGVREEGKLHEFYEHRAQRGAFGTFYVQDDIRKLGPAQPSDLFRTIPGMVISSGSGGNIMRIRGCQPMVWVDGSRVPGAELDEVIHPSEIAAIEFYASNAGVPPQYMERGNRLCGLVLVWTKTQ
ncbi:MAG TPA: carboxypeptidase regulatory-like domain-containing protein [Gemmatimonadaceae bacterium]|nr:carboxypeptidase regulatory-like domain-containing protein [Gemmatimonadaceae bacterium]